MQNVDEGADYWHIPIERPTLLCQQFELVEAEVTQEGDNLSEVCQLWLPSPINNLKPYLAGSIQNASLMSMGEVATCTIVEHRVHSTEEQNAKLALSMCCSLRNSIIQCMTYQVVAFI